MWYERCSGNGEVGLDITFRFQSDPPPEYIVTFHPLNPHDIVRALMTDFKIEVRDGIHLSSFRLSDKSALLEHFQSKDIYLTTLNIPFPYLESHADSWLLRRLEFSNSHVKEVSFAIRTSDEKLIGVVSADSLEPGTTHRAEIGYWLAKPCWGTGIMTDAVRAFVRYAFSDLGLSKITAHVFEHNMGSTRVLEKNGFVLEGKLRKHFRKDGELLDARIYGLLKDEAEINQQSAHD